MEHLVHWTSRYLDTRHLYEMTRSWCPRDLVTGCVQHHDHLLWDSGGDGLRAAAHLVCETITESPGSGVW